MAGAAPAGQGMVLTEEERERCRRALREELLSAAFVWTGKSGIPVGAEPAGALQEEFRSLADPVLNGVRYTGWTKCSYTLRDRTYLVETQAQSCAVQDGVLLSEKPSETLRNLRRLTSGKRYQACSRYFSDLAGEGGDPGAVGRGRRRPSWEHGPSCGVSGTPVPHFLGV